MKERPQKEKVKPITRNLFARLLFLWGEYRRFIILLVISLALYGFLSSLNSDTRRQLTSGLLAQRALITLLLIFSLLTLSLLWSAGQRLDTWVFLLFNLRGHHPLWLDRVMWVITQIGNGLVGIILGIVLYFVGYQGLAFELLLGIMTLWLAVELIKAVVERSRPFLLLENTRVVGWRERGKSFPSGHTSQAFFMMTLLIQFFQPGALLTSTLMGTAVLVGFTRIYVGAHYPRDVIGGAILGGVWGIFSSLIQVYRATGQF